jgi:hypothetical protein
MSSNGAGKESRPLEERIELPAIPQDAGRKIAQLEQEFIRAEVEQCTIFIPEFSPFRTR